MSAAQVSSGAPVQQWKPLGPTPTISGSNHYGAWTSSIAVDPGDPNTVYIGNPGSGVWKTSDGGATWNPKTDSAPALAIGAIVVAPSSPNVIYAGTGNWWDGAGLLKSTDKGETWNLLPGKFSMLNGSSEFWSAGFIFFSLSVSPTDPNLVLAGVWYGQPDVTGIYRSADGGITWQQVFSGGRGNSIVWDPQNPKNVYAAIGDGYWPSKNGIYKSTDAGVTWRSSSNGVDPNLLPNSANLFLTICSANSNILYASVPLLNNTGTLGVFKTVDGGANWTKVPAPSASRSYQIVVHPQDPDTVLVGDVTLYRSRDGGQTWDNVTLGSNGTWTFGDYRAFTFSADGQTLYIGSDGGVFKTGDARVDKVNWTALNDTLDTVLFYPRSPIAIHPTNVNIGLGGAQDLGILLYSGSPAWTQVQGCDGGTTLIDFVDPANTYATCNGITIFKSTQSGAAGSWRLAINGINTSDRAEFVPTIAMDPHDPKRLFFGAYRLYQSLDRASTWTPISGDVSNNCYAGVTSISVSPADSNFIYLGSLCGSVFVTTNSSSAFPNWTNRSAGLPNRTLTSVVADPTNTSTAYVTFSGFAYGSDKQGHVFRTNNGGVSWTDISGNLPNIPANHLAIDPDLPHTLYLATDVGVFYTSDGGATWGGLSNGLPHAYVEALLLHRPSRTLRASTMGRGMWDLVVPLGASYPPPALISISPATAPAGSTGIHLKVTGSGFAGQSLVQWNGTSLATTLVNSSGLDVILPDSDLAAAGVYPVRVVNPQPGGGTSAAVIFTVTPNLTSSGITNSASFVSGVSPGALATVFGHGLTTGVQGIVGVNSTPWPTEIQGTSVTISGVPAPIYAVANANGSEQINLQVPVEVAGSSSASLTVTNNGASATVPVQVVGAQPAVYTDGKGNGIVTRSTTAQLITASNPAIPGEYVTIYANALGALDVQPPTNVPASASPLSQTIQPPTVSIGGVAANVIFSGLTPYSIGLYQINVQVPDGITPATAVPVVVTAGGNRSKVVTIAVGEK